MLEVENPHINKLQLFTQIQGQIRANMLTGDHFPFSQHPVRYPHFLFPIQLQGQQVVDCYLWVDKHGEQLQIPLRLWDKAAFEEHTYVLYLFVGFMLGILSLYCILSFLTLLLSGSLIILIHVGILPDNYITQNFPLIANSLDVIILSVLLANRFKNIHLQNGQIAAELAEQRQRNAIQLLEGQIIERKRLSQELHDGISLSLSNIRMRLSLLVDNLNGQKKEAQQLVEALGDVGQDVRQFSHALSPVMLERYGLVDALEDLILQIKSGHPDLSVDFQHIDIQNEAIHPLVSQTIYQVSLELLNNVLKHARAKSVMMVLEQVEGQLLLQVSDDGQGYDVSEKTMGIGLQNIQARVQLLSGQFTVQRQPTGILHRIELPIQTRLFS